MTPDHKWPPETFAERNISADRSVYMILLRQPHCRDERQSVEDRSVNLLDKADTLFEGDVKEAIHVLKKTTILNNETCYFTQTFSIVISPV